MDRFLAFSSLARWLSGAATHSKSVYGFKIDNDEWTVDLKSGSGSVAKGSGAKPDCTIIMKEQDFVDLMTGKLNGQSAFMSGKMKIKGNMGAAMKLGKLAQAKPKAKL